MQHLEALLRLPAQAAAARGTKGAPPEYAAALRAVARHSAAQVLREP